MHKATILLFLPWVMVAETHTVAAEKYYRTFSHQHPVLKRILPGDTVITKTVDSGGKDEKGVEAMGDFAPTSGPAGSYGGNLDYNAVGEGATVILPAYHPGALLFIGDGHALQGDGEATGNGVETSMDVEFSVEVRKKIKLTG